MATHSSVLAWRIPGMAEPGGLPSMGSHRVGHDWSDLAAAADIYSSVGKESACNSGNPGSISESGRSAGERIGYPFQDSWASLVVPLIKNPPAIRWIRPRFDPWVGKIPWRREQLSTPVLWPGEFHGLYSPWDGKELDTTEWPSLSHIY